LSGRLVAPWYPSYAGAATIGRIELVLDLDLLAKAGPLAAIVEKRVDVAPVNVHQHDPVDVVVSHRFDDSAAAEVGQAA
jgi:hypothetical protein